MSLKYFYVLLLLTVSSPFMVILKISELTKDFLKTFFQEEKYSGLFILMLKFGLSEKHKKFDLFVILVTRSHGNFLTDEKIAVTSSVNFKMMNFFKL